MKKIQKLLALMLALTLALSMAVPAMAATEQEMRFAEILKMKNEEKSPATPDTLVYPYAQAFGTAVLREGVALLEFKLTNRANSGDLLDVIICRGSADEVLASEDPVIVEERFYKMSDFHNGSIAITWKADSRYPVGEYTLLAVLLDSEGFAYIQNYYAVDLYVVNQNIPAIDMEVMEVWHGNYHDITGTISLEDTYCFAYALIPYVNTANRKTTVTVEHPEILSADVDAGYVYITCKGFGDTSFTITCGDVKKTVPISAGRDSIGSINAEGTKTELCIGMRDTLSVNCSPNSVPYVLEWKSENPEVVSVKDGVVTAVGPGTAKVIITCAGSTATVPYTVHLHALPAGTPVSERTATRPAMAVGHCSLCGQDDAVNIIEKAIFTDTNDKSWYADHVDYVYDKGIMNGTSSTTFAPDRAMTRAELVTVLYRIAGSPKVTFDGAFTDVPDGTWYSKAVTWAAQNKIVNGVGDNRFAPTANITREQIATILYRYTKTLGVEMAEGVALNTFPDSGDVSGYAKDAMAWAVAEKLINGTVSGGVTTLAPQATATRAQLATIISRYQQMFAKNEA